jgi:RNA polymerase sigma factor (sigma-70 family)
MDHDVDSPAADLGGAATATAERQPLRSRAERDALVLKWLPLVTHVIKRLGMGGRRDFDDLHSAGVIALIHAAEVYDPARSASFMTAAYCWLRQKISRYAADHSSTIRVPAHVRGDLRRELLAKTRAAHLPDDWDATQDDAAAAELEQADLAADVERALATLQPRYAAVLRLRYLGAGLTMQEAGKRLGVSRARVQQIEVKALTQLAARAPWLVDWLDSKAG